MRWRTGRRSSNVEDRRGRGGGIFGGLGRGRGGPGMRVPSGRGIKLGGLGTIIVFVIALLLGADPMALLNSLGGGAASLPPSQSQSRPQTQPGQTGQPSDEQADFISVVLADTEDVWSGLFSASGQRYQPPTLVLFTDVVQSACGMASAAAGPFYCPGDAKVYIDLGFFNELKRLGAAGDFAQAYVLAHEVGHHIQNITGTERQMRQLQRQVGKTQSNQLSVLMELQADCYAGVWAHHAQRQRQILEQGDIEEGLSAAAAVGDDRLQKMSTGRVRPESFTHGTSGQRTRWFKTGLQSGQVARCDTFKQAGL